MDAELAQAQHGLGPTALERTPSVAQPWILMYHSVADAQEDPYLLTVSPARFAAQMAWLHRTGRRGVSVRELLRAEAEGAPTHRLVGLTFDDGYADFADQAVPVLNRYGFTASAYLVPDLLGRDNRWDPDGPRKPLLTVAQARRLALEGWEIGSHGLSHTALPGLTAERLAEQTAESRRLLEELTQGPVTGFCYPYGALDLPAVLAVRAAGYEYACAIEHSPLTGRFALPRCYVGERDGGWRLTAKQGRHRWRDTLTTFRRTR